jgi:hypothetical protein
MLPLDPTTGRSRTSAKLAKPHTRADLTHRVVPAGRHGHSPENP